MKIFINILLFFISLLLFACGDKNKQVHQSSTPTFNMKSAPYFEPLVGYWKSEKANEIVKIDRLYSSQTANGKLVITAPHSVYRFDDHFFVPNTYIQLESSGVNRFKGVKKIEEWRSKIVGSLFSEVEVKSDQELRIAIGYTNISGNFSSTSVDTYKRLPVLKGQKLFQASLIDMTRKIGRIYFGQFFVCEKDNLEQAAHYNQIECLQKFAQNPPLIGEEWQEKVDSALSKSASASFTYIDSDTAKILLEMGGDPNFPLDGTNALDILFTGLKWGIFGDYEAGLDIYADVENYVATMLSAGGQLSKKEQKESFSILYRTLQNGWINLSNNIFDNNYAEYTKGIDGMNGYNRYYAYFQSFESKFAANMEQGCALFAKLQMHEDTYDLQEAVLKSSSDLTYSLINCLEKFHPEIFVDQKVSVNKKELIEEIEHSRKYSQKGFGIERQINIEKLTDLENAKAYLESKGYTFEQ